MATVKVVGAFTDGIRRELVRATVVPAITAGLYAAGQCLGSLLEFSVNDIPKEELVLLGLQLSDATLQKSAIDVLIFDTEPVNTAFTDNAALAMNAADLPGHVDTVALATASYEAFSANGVVAARNLRIPILSATTKFWVALVCRGTPTYTAVNNLALKLLLARRPS